MGRRVLLMLFTGLQAVSLKLPLTGFCSTKSVPPSIHPASTSVWLVLRGRFLKWEHENRRKRYCNHPLSIRLLTTPQICFTELRVGAWLDCGSLKRLEK